MMNDDAFELTCRGGFENLQLDVGVGDPSRINYVKPNLLDDFEYHLLDNVEHVLLHDVEHF
jgi:hypothetical protein